MDAFSLASGSALTLSDAEERARAPRPARAASSVRSASRFDTGSPAVRYWFAFDRWLPIVEDDDFVLA
jgi:hypothetical protein